MVPCPLCSLPLTLPTRGVEATLHCPGCRREVTGVVWPAAERGPVRVLRPQAVAEGGAACFSCPDRAATGVCDGCGCYTCPACEADWFGDSLCLTCLHARREVMNAPRFRHRALVHDNIALMMLALPIFVIPVYGFFFAVLASPVALFLVIRHRNAPRGLPPRGPFRLFLAGGLALLLMLLVVAGIGAGVYSMVEMNQRLAARAGDEAAASAEGAPAGDPAAAPSTGEDETP